MQREADAYGGSRPWAAVVQVGMGTEAPHATHWDYSQKKHTRHNGGRAGGGGGGGDRIRIHTPGFAWRALGPWPCPTGRSLNPSAS